MSLFKELKRRNVFRVGIAYAVTTWLLLQITDIVFPRIGLPDSAITLVIALLAIGFIPALIFAWAFEMTPEGIKRDKDVDRRQSITSKTGRKLDYAIIGIMAVVIVFLVVDRFVLAPKAGSGSISPQVSQTNVLPGEEKMNLTHIGATPAEATAISIAVLPFVNMSADADNEYFSDGITEELLNVLAKVSALHVASRTSAFAYKGKDLPITQIARELKVSNILEGSVRKAGNRVRITAQLIDAESDRHIWSETYERELVDIFDIQEEISNHIVAALKVVLNVDETAALERAQRPTANTEAYELYLQGRFAWRQRHEENIRKSIELFDKAIALDPDFARAYEALAVAWSVLPSWSNTSAVESTLHSKPAAMHALQLDPTLTEARAVLAEAALDEHLWAKGVTGYLEAISNDPRNPTVHQWLGEAYAFLGLLSQGLDQMRIAYDLDPASPVINTSMVWLSTLKGEDDLAFKHVEISNSLGMSERSATTSIEAYARRGDWDTVFAALDMLDDTSDVLHNCIKARHDPSIAAQLATQLDQFIDGLDQDVPRLFPSIVYCLALTGQPERAAEMTLRDIEDGWQALWIFWANIPEAGAMRQTQLFRETLADLGLLDFYREHGWPDSCRPLGEHDFECDP